MRPSESQLIEDREIRTGQETTGTRSIPKLAVMKILLSRGENARLLMQLECRPSNAATAVVFLVSYISAQRTRIKTIIGNTVEL